MKKLYLLLIINLFIFELNAQTYNSNRYQKSIFPTSTATNNVVYGSAPVWTIPYSNEDLKLNVYVPNGDQNTKRPLIIFAHAGGFLNGNKDVDEMIALCDTFVQKGFVTATIDYRKGFNPLDGESAERAVYRGIQDGKTAVRYFKANADLYNIDTNYVFFGGTSAGGFIALHVGYMDKESERPNSTYGDWIANDLGCLDCGSHTGVSSTVKGVLDFWGAVQDTSIIESNGPPIQIMHGENDPTVPFSLGHPFGVFTIPMVYGAENIKIRCDNVGISNTYTTSTGPLHMLDGSDNGTWNPAPNEFWSDTLIPKTTSFLYELVKPTTTFISSQNDMICQNNNLNLEVTREHENSYFIWDFDNSEINTNGDINNNTLSFDFNSPGIYSISVVEFNEILCAGDTLTFNIEVHEAPEADFMYFSDLFEFEFTNLSSNAVSYAWDFGDGNTSTDENPIHTYSEVGDYEVSLTVTSADNCTSTFTQTVNIINVLGLTEDGNELTYASPFTHTFELTSVNTLGQITIISIDGKKVYNNYHQDNSIIIDTESWSKGIYFVNLTNEDGGPKQFKVIKQ